MPEFTPWPKTKRLFRDIVITEKIDGTNAAIHISPEGEVGAQSRTRIITPESDNFGFATWVQAHAATLLALLGPGLHFGEWWGGKIQRGYGVKDKTFSLFNTDRYVGVDQTLHDYTRITTVPVLYRGPFHTENVLEVAADLAAHGSHASPGFMHPEGVCIFHTHLGVVTKFTLDGDGHKDYRQEKAS